MAVTKGSTPSSRHAMAVNGKRSTSSLPWATTIAGVLLAIVVAINNRLETYDEALAQIYQTRSKCSVVWREPESVLLEDGLLQTLQDVASPNRVTVLHASGEYEAARLSAAAAASQRRLGELDSAEAIGSKSAAALLRRLVAALESDAASFDAVQPEHTRRAARETATDAYFSLSLQARVDARLSAGDPLSRLAAAIVRAAVARFAMLASDPFDRYMALSTWIEDGASKQFCAPGTDPEMTMLARLVVDSLAPADRARVPRSRLLAWLEDAHVVASKLGALARRFPSDGDRLLRFVANARLAATLLVEELGGLRTPTDEAEYGRAASLLAPVEAAIRDEPS